MEQSNNLSSPDTKAAVKIKKPNDHKKGQQRQESHGQIIKATIGVRCFVKRKKKPRPGGLILREKRKETKDIRIQRKGNEI